MGNRLSFIDLENWLEGRTTEYASMTKDGKRYALIMQQYADLDGVVHTTFYLTEDGERIGLGKSEALYQTTEEAINAWNERFA